jgi:hypothetical protein
MGSLFSRPKTPKIPDIPEPPPETPPLASSEDNVVREQKKLRRKMGDKANLMTGGLGLAQLSPGQLYMHTLGGYTQTGVKKNA